MRRRWCDEEKVSLRTTCPDRRRFSSSPVPFFLPVSVSLSSPVVFVFSLSSGRFRFSLSSGRVRFLSVFSGYCFLCSVSLCFLCSVSVFDVLLRVQILVLFRVLFLRLCFVFSLFSPVSVSWSIFCFLFMRIAGGGAFVLGDGSGVDGSDEECGGGADVLSGSGSVSSHNGGGYGSDGGGGCEELG
jgi:hypothetical protein